MLKTLIAGGLACLVAGHAVAAEPLWVLPNEVEGGHEVLLADCGGDEAGECVRMTLGCKGDVGTVGLSDGGALALRMIERNDLADMVLAFSIGAATISAEAGGIDLEPNGMDGGWWVSFPSYDMGAVFAVVAEQPDAKFGVSIAGQSFDLTPRQEDREALREFAAKCAPR